MIWDSAGLILGLKADLGSEEPLCLLLRAGSFVGPGQLSLERMLQGNWSDFGLDPISLL